MNPKFAWFAGAALLSASVVLYSTESAQTAAQTGKPVKINRLYTGPDGKTRAQEIEVKFGPGGTDGFKLMAGAGAEIRRAPPGRVVDWHPAPRRQYIVNLDAGVKITASDGEARIIGPGEIILVEDISGKGHLSQSVNGALRHSLFIPID